MTVAHIRFTLYLLINPISNISLPRTFACCKIRLLAVLARASGLEALNMSALPPAPAPSAKNTKDQSVATATVLPT